MSLHQQVRYHAERCEYLMRQLHTLKDIQTPELSEATGRLLVLWHDHWTQMRRALLAIDPRLVHDEKGAAA